MHHIRRRHLVDQNRIPRNPQQSHQLRRHPRTLYVIYNLFLQNEFKPLFNENEYKIIKFLKFTKLLNLHHLQHLQNLQHLEY